MTQNPLVSIIMASYQHENFIIEAIQSVLEQSYQNFEIIITDDGSSDETISKINRISDPRIRLFELKENMGACVAINNCIVNSNGEYIAVINSDDVWVKEKLQKQIDFLSMNNHISAVFSTAEFFDEDSNKISFEDEPSFSDIFNQKNRSSGEWLYQFFFKGNCLCHPSILIKKSCYEVLGLYDNRYRQLPDLDMWIKFCKHFKLFVMPEKLVKFRILKGNKNASSPSVDNQVRGRNEKHLIMQNFFDQMPIEIFKQGFADLLKNSQFTTQSEYEVEQAFLYLNTPHKIIGIEKLYKLLNNDNFNNALKSYNITNKEFHQITSQYTSFSYISKSDLIKLTIREIWIYPKIMLFKRFLRYIINSLKYK